MCVVYIFFKVCYRVFLVKSKLIKSWIGSGSGVLAWDFWKWSWFCYKVGVGVGLFFVKEGVFIDEMWARRKNKEELGKI